MGLLPVDPHVASLKATPKETNLKYRCPHEFTSLVLRVFPFNFILIEVLLEAVELLFMSVCTAYTPINDHIALYRLGQTVGGTRPCDAVNEGIRLC